MTPEEARIILAVSGSVVGSLVVIAMLVKVFVCLKRKFPNFIIGVEKFFLASLTFALTITLTIMIVFVILRACELL
jgi:hypothetical protein